MLPRGPQPGGPGGTPGTNQAPPPEVDLETIRTATSIRTYPNGDLNLNPVGLMLGWEAYELYRRGGAQAAYQEARRRVLAHWHLLQTRHGMEDWELTWISPALGVRETHRLVARYVLREGDCRAGLAAQEASGTERRGGHRRPRPGLSRGRAVGEPRAGRAVRDPLPLPPGGELDNLLSACRGAGFSAVAATSCRLSRTMMTLGQAAGTAAALFGQDVTRFDPQALRRALRQDGVALSLAEGYLDAIKSGHPHPPTPSRERGLGGEGLSP